MLKMIDIADMPNHSSLVRLGSIASDQWGLVTRRQPSSRGSHLPPWHASARTVGSSTEWPMASTSWLGSGAGTSRPSCRVAPTCAGDACWERTSADGVVSHRSAASIYRVGDLPADRHEFMLPERRQTRRSDVRLHTRPLRRDEWIELRGLPVTRPSRTASDLLYDNEDPEAIARIVADSLRGILDDARAVADSLAPHASRFGLRRGDGRALLRWLLELSDDPDVPRWLEDADANERMAKRPREAIAAS